MNLIHLNNISVDYGKKENKTHALKNVDLEVQQGEFVAIMGKSGSGKTTLLNVIGTMLTPDGGMYEFNGQSIAYKKDSEKARFRNENMGFVVQHFALVQDMTVYENVALPLRYRKISRNEVHKKVEAILNKLEIIDQKNKYPYQLSGGQKQRVAIARAMVTDPRLLLADEPTGSLDEENGNNTIELLEKMNKNGVTIVMVTHDSELAQHASRIIFMQDGQIKDCPS